MRPSRKWLEGAAELYRWFEGSDAERYDWSPEAAAEMYEYESRATGPIEERGRLQKRPSGMFNGYECGKSSMDITVALWKQDLASGLLFVGELLADVPRRHWPWLLKAVGRQDMEPFCDRLRDHVVSLRNR